MCTLAWEFYARGISYYNGWRVWQDQDERYRYQADDTLISRDVWRACPRCRRRPTRDKDDACLGRLAGVRVACCGHGRVELAYVVRDDEGQTPLYGPDAVRFFVDLGRKPYWVPERHFFLGDGEG